MEHQEPLPLCEERHKEMSKDLDDTKESARENIRRIHDKIEDSNRMLAENNSLLTGTMEKINGYVEKSDLKDTNLKESIEALDKKLEVHERTKHLKPWAWVGIVVGLLSIIWLGGNILERQRDNQIKQGGRNETITRHAVTNH